MNEPLMEIGEVLTDFLKVLLRNLLHMKTPPCYFLLYFYLLIIGTVFKAVLENILTYNGNLAKSRAFFSAEQREELDRELSGIQHLRSCTHLT